ncbi:hypothetical protein D3C85_1350730 [compost metagenome]
MCQREIQDPKTFTYKGIEVTDDLFYILHPVVKVVKGMCSLDVKDNVQGIEIAILIFVPVFEKFNPLSRVNLIFRSWCCTDVCKFLRKSLLVGTG